jgi:hypothetical protein
LTLFFHFQSTGQIHWHASLTWESRVPRAEVTSYFCIKIAQHSKLVKNFHIRGTPTTFEGTIHEKQGSHQSLFSAFSFKHFTFNKKNVKILGLWKYK